MEKSTLLKPGLFPGFTSDVEPNKYGPQIGDESKKGPPPIATVYSVYFNAADRTIANDGTINYIIKNN